MKEEEAVHIDTRVVPAPLADPDLNAAKKLVLDPEVTIVAIQQALPPGCMWLESHEILPASKYN